MDRKERIDNLISALIPWYEGCGRNLPWREDPTPYRVWISEIMLQQTRIETVIPYYERFLRELPDIRSLAEADPERLQKLWEGLGYYSRVRNLQAAARQIQSQFDGCFPENYEDIRSLCGIGDYTAGAIASICFGFPTPAVDGNVLRVLSRVTEDSRPISAEKTKKEVRAELTAAYPTDKAGICTQAIMELGEVICLPNGVPACDRCPCRAFCGSSRGGWMSYPVKAEKKARRSEQLTLFLLRCGTRTAIRKRPETGLLSGQWEFPNCPGHLTVEDALRQAELWGCRPSGLREEAPVSHIFTHVEWHMRCFSVYCAAPAPDFVWVDDAQLKDAVSLPTAFRKVLSNGPSQINSRTGDSMILTTNRLRIRLASDEEMRLLIANETDPDMIQAYGEMRDLALARPEERQWAAVWFIERKDGCRIGDLCFKGLPPDGRVEIGYGLLPEYWGQGYATEAVVAMVAWARTQPGVTAVEAEAEASNLASLRVLEKSGFVPTGVIGEEGPRFVWAE